MTRPTSTQDSVVAQARALLLPALDEIGVMLTRERGDVFSTPKSDGTPVTADDVAVDQRLREVIDDAFPDHGVVSEEGTTLAPDTEWTWVIDPIDGTSNYATGLPYWCVSVALTHRGIPLLGVVDAPAMGRRYVGMAGHGAWRDGRRLSVRPGVDFTSGANRHVPVMLSTGSVRRARAAGVRLNARIMGSIALDLAMVAEGLAVASLATIPHVWDVAAGKVLVEEAGGAFLQIRGEDLLPLVVGRDHVQAWAPVAAAAEARYARQLAAALLPKPS